MGNRDGFGSEVKFNSCNFYLKYKRGFLVEEPEGRVEGVDKFRHKRNSPIFVILIETRGWIEGGRVMG